MPECLHFTQAIPQKTGSSHLPHTLFLKTSTTNPIPSSCVQCAQDREIIQKEQDNSLRKCKKSESGINSQWSFEKLDLGLCELADQYYWSFEQGIFGGDLK